MTTAKLTEFISICSYLHNLFTDNSYEVSKEDTGYGYKLVKLRCTAETESLFKIINFIAENQKNISKVEIGFFGVNSFSTPKKIISLNFNKNINDLTSLIKYIQKEGYEHFKLKFRIHSEELKRNDLFKMAEKMWVVDKMFVEDFGGIKVIEKGMSKVVDNNVKNDINTCIDVGLSVKCLCTINFDDGDMLQCDLCKKWSHTVCSGYFSNKDKRIPKECICAFCKEQIDQKSRDLAFRRRIVDILFNEPLEGTNMNKTAQFLSERLGCSEKSAYKELFALKKDEIILQKNAKSPIEISYTEKSKNAVKKLFKAKSLLVYETDFINEQK